MKTRQIREVAMREFRTRARSKGYKVTTAIMVLLAVAAPIAIRFFPDPSDSLREVSIAVASGIPDQVDGALELFATDLVDLDLVDLRNASSEEVQRQVADGEVDVVLQPPATLLWNDTSDSTISQLVTAALQQSAAIDRANELGIDVEDLGNIFGPVEVEDEFLSGDSDSQNIRTGVALFGLFTAFLLPQIFGQFTMMSVVEEKQTRVVEVLLSQIRPSTLLAGKIAGINALAVVQLFVVLLGLVASFLANDTFDIPASVWRFVPMLIVCVLGGLLIYTTLFALLGSLISRQEDQAQVMAPVFLPLMAGYFVGQAAAIDSADSLVVKIMTWIPLTTPLVLPVRVAKDAIGPIETILVLALLVLATYAIYRLAAKVYEFTLLRTGSRVGWGEVARLGRATQ